MNDQEILKSATYLCEVYNRNSNPGLLEIMAEMYRDWSCEDFMACARKHIKDPDRGRFFPTPADMEYQLRGDRNHAKISAAEAFDLDPLIDGTRKFEADRETYEQRDRRKRAYIAQAAHEFEGHSGDPERPILPGVRRGLIGGGKRGAH
jgi:hypothetical protein